MRIASLVLLAVWPGAAAAQGFENCSKLEARVAGAALDGAVTLALLAADSVADTPAYVRWFGEWDEDRAATVRRTLRRTATVLQDPSLTFACLAPARIECKGDKRDDIYGFVLYDRPRIVHLCPSFFRMPGIADAKRGLGDQTDGTREGTIIHEVTHFPSVAGTVDECYSRPVCEGMALSDPDLAVINADSFQYFAEDVTIEALHPR
ncbi:M35 family metallo-endopeptidase [Rubellimicrobium sp. CFH 75288]|uniref:M35 family metallo-endopeptidase n=1 Tax=Rubellimicrobium sp. CFH 75288 TaxID=2697034 RepID=UPI0014137747|nr:M35 family metallo-endopeptidase [Rubellimicrobium sp. CFH 75288]NAZ35204.1 protease [Rubellimicrobium sp. CFH 75288]